MGWSYIDVYSKRFNSHLHRAYFTFFEVRESNPRRPGIATATDWFELGDSNLRRPSIATSTGWCATHTYATLLWGFAGALPNGHEAARSFEIFVIDHNSQFPYIGSLTYISSHEESLDFWAVL